MKLPIRAAFVTKEFQGVFDTTAHVPLTEFAAMWDIPIEWMNDAILASGSNDYLNFVLSKLRNHDGIFVYATDYIFKERRSRDVARQFKKWAILREQVGLQSRILAHEEFGGVSSAFHLISCRGVDPIVFSPPHSLPRVLAHVLDATTPDAGKEISRPAPLTATPRSPIISDGLLRAEGLFDVFRPHLRIASPCVFKSTGWTQRPLSAREHLRVFDVPLYMDAALLDKCRERRIKTVLQRGITPLIASTVIRALWSNRGGGMSKGGTTAQPEQLTVHNERAKDVTTEQPEPLTLHEGVRTKDIKSGRRLAKAGSKKEKGEHMKSSIMNSLTELEITHLARGWSEFTRRKFGVQDWLLPRRGGDENLGVAARDAMLLESSSEAAEIRVSDLSEVLFNLKEKHDIAKAVKADDARVPVELWDEAVCRGPPSAEQQHALQVIRKFMLRKYCLSLCQDALHFLRKTHGTNWGEKLRSRNKHTKEDVEAIRDILWRASENDWFEYPCGSHLIFFRFPQMYQLQAKRGVRVMFTQKGPTARRRQSPLDPDEKEVLRAKIRKFIERKYIAPPTGWMVPHKILCCTQGPR